MILCDVFLRPIYQLSLRFLPGKISSSLNCLLAYQKHKNMDILFLKVYKILLVLRVYCPAIFLLLSRANIIPKLVHSHGIVLQLYNDYQGTRKIQKVTIIIVTPLLFLLFQPRQVSDHFSLSLLLQLALGKKSSSQKEKIFRLILISNISEVTSSSSLLHEKMLPGEEAIYSLIHLSHVSMLSSSLTEPS